jgi:hypothetical protein
MLARIFGEMYNLKAIAGVLTRLPLTDRKGDKRRAGPPFQMPYTLSPPLPEANFWRMHLDLLGASTTLANSLLDAALVTGGPVDGVRYLQAMRAADADVCTWINEVIAGIDATRRALV